MSDETTIGDILDRLPRRDANPFPKSEPPGIYFGMSEKWYHAIPAFSASGARDMLISPLNYWSNSVHNPNRKERETKATLDGKAFHCRLLEPERFASAYAAKPSKDDYPDAIAGGDALAVECARLGLKKSGTTEERCERLLEAEPALQLWPAIEQELLEGLIGRELLAKETMADIERAARIVLAHQSASRAISGGVSEVAILWTDEETGAPMKMRADYLKTKVIIDCKTFSNILGKPLNKAIASAVTNHRYDVQAAVYCDGVEHAKAMLRRDKSRAIRSGHDAVDNDWLVAFASCERHTFAFLFIQSGPVTNVRMREFRERDREGASVNMCWDAGQKGYRYAVERYAECMRKFGPDKEWVEDEPMQPFVDQDFPLWLYD